jgi:hypothetical protein
MRIVTVVGARPVVHHKISPYTVKNEFKELSIFLLDVSS